MNKVLTLTTFALVLLAEPAWAQKQAAPAAPAPAAAAGSTPMRPGLWETSLEVQTAGSDTKRTIVSRTCYADTDVTDVARVLPRQREPGMKCENRDVRMQAGKATWQIACSSAEGSLAGPAELTLGASSYAGKAQLERKKKGAKPEKVSSTVSAKWVEACK